MQRYYSQSDPEQEKLLLEDLMSVGQFIESHKTGFRVTRLSPDRFDRLSIYVPVQDNEAKIVVKFSEYPAIRLPQIEPKNQDELSWLVTKLVRDTLSKRKGSIRLQDIMNTLTGIVARLAKEDDFYARKKDKNQQAGRSLLDIIKSFLGKQNITDYEFNDRHDNAARESDFQSTDLKDAHNIRIEQVPNAIPHVDEIIIPQRIIAEIIEDHKRYKPNEYGFMCSGFLKKSGLAVIFDYYPGEMKTSTPVYCELTDRFIEKVIYDWSPDDHNLIVWGHVHPIEGPSHTDSTSFEEIAKWDIDIRKQRVIQKRSVAMLINAHTYSIRLYDVHFHQPIRNCVISSPRYHGYDS